MPLCRETGDTGDTGNFLRRKFPEPFKELADGLWQQCLYAEIRENGGRGGFLGRKPPTPKELADGLREECVLSRGILPAAKLWRISEEAP